MSVLAGFAEWGFRAQFRSGFLDDEDPGREVVSYVSLQISANHSRYVSAWRFKSK